MTDSAPVYALGGIGKAFARHGMTDHKAGRYAKLPPGSLQGLYFENQWRNEGSGIDRVTRDRHKVQHEVEDA